MKKKHDLLSLIDYINKYESINGSADFPGW